MKEFRFLSPVELLELLRKQQEIKGLPTSDYRLAKIIGITQSSIIKIMKHNGSLSDENAIILANELQLPHSYVVACMARHRVHNPELIEMWEEIGFNAMKNIAFVVLGFGLHYVSFLNFLPFN